MKTRLPLIAIIWMFSQILPSAFGVSPEAQAKIDEQFKICAAWAADPVIVEGVRAHNASVPAGQADLTQDKWQTLAALDPLVRSFEKNPVGQFLKSKKSEGVAEAFVSDAAGLKVGFLAKTTNWCHKGKPKHDVPMTGKNWQGPIELDESSGQRQIQISVPP